MKSTSDFIAERPRQPRTFRDKEGHVWDVSLDLGLVEDIDKADFSIYLPDEIIPNGEDAPIRRKRTQLILLKGERTDITLIMSDTALLFAVIWVVVQEQLAGHGIVSSEQADEDTRQRQFVRLMNGTAAEEAREAFMESLGDFFPAARTALLKLWSMMKTSTDRMNSRLNNIDQEAMQVLDKKLDQAMERFRAELAKA